MLRRVLLALAAVVTLTACTSTAVEPAETFTALPTVELDGKAYRLTNGELGELKIGYAGYIGADVLYVDPAPDASQRWYVLRSTHLAPAATSAQSILVWHDYNSARIVFNVTTACIAQNAKTMNPAKAWQDLQLTAAEEPILAVVAHGDDCAATMIAAAK